MPVYMKWPSTDRGRIGRLGNVMFIYASLTGIAHRWNTQAYFQLAYDVHTHLDNVPQEVFTLEGAEFATCPGHIPAVGGPIIHNPEHIMNSYYGNIAFTGGYFQSEQYFRDCKDKILRMFQFKEHIKAEADRILLELNINQFAYLHFRGGDFKTSKNHGLLGMDYYEKALDLIPSDIPVLVFSNDEMVRDFDLFKSDRFFYMPQRTGGQDLCLMSKAEYGIAGNSTFSWWANYLSNAKKKFVPGGRTVVTFRDNPLHWVYPEEFTILDCA